MFYVYFAKSLKNDKIYVGHTSKTPTERIKEHNEGANAWSKNNGPFKLVYYESYTCKADAFAREQFYKTGIGRKIKKAIVDSMGS
jgi:putative endonuclease